jgi:hypothetical protein
VLRSLSADLALELSDQRLEFSLFLWALMLAS